MILCSLDFESTGLDFQKDRIIEVGLILYSTTQKRILESQGFLVKSDVPISEEITGITGLTQQAVDKFGRENEDALEQLSYYLDSCNAVIGHNVNRFDKRMAQEWYKRSGLSHFPGQLWIDTFTDLPDTFATKLGYMAADKGFLNLFPHGAITDCFTVLKLIENYDIEKVVERAKSPMVVVRAHVNFDNNELAKKAKFRWFPAPKKWWWRWMKEMDVESFAKTVQFDISVHRENIEEFQDL